VPAVTGIIPPWLTPLAAFLGLVSFDRALAPLWCMLDATRWDQVSCINVVLLVLAVFVVFGRFVSSPL